jgi:hypothetical protein
MPTSAHLSQVRLNHPSVKGGLNKFWVKKEKSSGYKKVKQKQVNIDVYNEDEEGSVERPEVVAH